jgi:transcriptional regulator with GAF, ATPase, and Fis domain/HAMP domain-containing protein
MPLAFALFNRRFFQDQSRSLLLLIAPLFLLFCLSLTAAVFSLAYQQHREQVGSLLAFIVETQADKTSGMVRSQEEILAGISRDSSLSLTLEQVLEVDRSSAAFTERRAAFFRLARSSFAGKQGSVLHQLLLVQPDGKVILADNPAWEGQILQITGPATGLLEERKSFVLYDHPLSPEGLVVMTTQPLALVSGLQETILLGVTDHIAFDYRLISGLTALPDSRAYFFTREGVFATSLSGRDGLLPLPAVGEQTSMLLPEGRGSTSAGIIEFISFSSLSVLAYTHYLPELDAALVVEVPRRTVFQMLLPGAILPGAVLAGSLVLLFLAVVLVSRHSSTPLNELSETVQQYLQGNREQRSYLRRNDEIGLLSEAFNQMADELNVLKDMLSQEEEGKEHPMQIGATHLTESAQVDMDEASLLYHATQQIARSETAEEIFYALIHTLKKSTYQSLVLAEKDHFLHLLSVNSSRQAASGKVRTAWAPFAQEDIDSFLPTGYPLIISNFRHTPKMPAALLEILQDWKCQAAAFIPVRRSGQVVALFVLGSEERSAFSPTSIQPFANLAELTATALQKVAALETMKKRILELEILNLVSEAVSGQTDLETACVSIHAAIERSLRVSNFFIALYDAGSETIQIPYMFDQGRVRAVDPFPLGEGLTSILIKTRQPLMLVENTEQRSKELGAKQLGAPAKSWLGVPLIHGGVVLGAIVVQDLEKEHRFNQDDLRLLTSTSRLIAAALRNVQLLEQFRKQTERERLLHETSRRIRETMDMHSILEVTARELSTALGMKRARIVLSPAGPSPVQTAENGGRKGLADADADHEGDLQA